MESVFLSFGGPDQAFAKRLNHALNSAGIPTFFFPRDAQPGEKLHRVMRDGVNSYDKVVFVCSKDSLNRPGVVNELEETLQREAREGGVSILVPIALDDHVFHGWNPARTGLRQAVQDRVVADFRGTARNATKFQEAVKKLIRSLGANPSITNIAIVSRVEIIDPAGHEARWLMEKTIVAHESVTRLANREIVGSGSIKVIDTNMGSIDEIVFEGGSQTVYTRLDEPLPIGLPVTHSLEFKVIDCFLATEEDYAFRIHNHYERMEIHISVPAVRPVDSAIAYHRIRGVQYPYDGLIVNEGKTLLSLIVANPEVGTAYRIVWRW